MRTHTQTRRFSTTRLAAAAVMSVLALTACGGGGDGGPAPEKATIALTATNRDTVAHAVVAGVESFATLGSVPVTATASSGAIQVSGGGPIGAIVGRVIVATRDRMQALAARERAATVYPPETMPCSVSGTWTGTVDDHDDSGTLTVGDKITVSFADCVDFDDVVMNGAFDTLFTSATSETSYGGTITTTNLSQSTSMHTITLNGAIAFNHNGGTTGTETYTAKGDVVVDVQTHLPFSDTVTLLSGYVEKDSYDLEALPPEGGSPGRLAFTASGSLRSAKAGGVVTVTTPTPVVVYALDTYPRSGVVQARGSTGMMQLTAQSQTNVLLELDADDNGQYESTETVTWEWLL
jgi:hypothetical protein